MKAYYLSADAPGDSVAHEFEAPSLELARFRVIEQSHMEFPGRVWKLRAILEAVK